MFKVVKIGEKDVPMLSNAATPYRYKQMYGMDLMNEMSKLDENKPTEAIEVVEQLAFIMSKAAEKADMNMLNMEMYYDWLEQFDSDDMINAFKDIVTLYIGNIKTSSKSKN